MHLKETLGAHAPGVHHALRDLLPVELAQLLQQVVILQEHRACSQERSFVIKLAVQYRMDQCDLLQRNAAGKDKTDWLPTSVASFKGELIADDGGASVGGQLLSVELHVRHARSILFPAAALQSKGYTILPQSSYT